MFLNNDDFYQLRRITLSDLLDSQSGFRLTNRVIAQAKRELYKVIKPDSVASKKRKRKIADDEEADPEDYQALMDLFENEEGSLDGLRSSIYKISHSIFSTNPKDIKYFLGKRLETTDGYNDEIYKKEVNEVIEKRGSLKSCLVGCDSHTESTLFNRYTWIKGKLNFEGLRQICFEPEQRVKFKIPSLILKKIK